MRIPTYLLIACWTGFGLLMQGCPPQPNNKKPATVGENDAVRLKSVLDVANQAVTKAEKAQELKGSPLRLQSASFTFNTVTTGSGGGELGVLVLNASFDITKQDTETATYSYERPKINLLAASLDNNVEKLADAINRKLNAAVPDFHHIPLKEVKVTVDFSVERKAGGSLKIPVWSVTLGPRGSGSKKAVQTINLVFGK